MMRWHKPHNVKKWQLALSMAFVCGMVIVVIAQIVAMFVIEDWGLILAVLYLVWILYIQVLGYQDLRDTYRKEQKIRKELEQKEEFRSWRAGPSAIT